MATSDNEWYNELLFWLIFFIFRIREEPSIRHPKDNLLNLEEDLEEDLQTKSRFSKTSSLEEILAARSKY